jgi:hypothetical protein
MPRNAILSSIWMMNGHPMTIIFPLHKGKSSPYRVDPGELQCGWREAAGDVPIIVENGGAALLALSR